MATKKIALILTVFTILSVGTLVSPPTSQAASVWETVKQKLGLGQGPQKDIQEQAESISKGKTGNANIGDLGTNVNSVLQRDWYLRLAGTPESATAYLTPDQYLALEEQYGNGAIGDVSQAVAFLYNQPASTQTYVADVLNSAHIVPKAQAQGLGFAALNPILDTWKVFRNVAYLFFVIMFLVIGFMIMFRQKISGQAVVTAQQAIPQIIISLIFVSFSYPIAGLMIDLMYLFMYLLIGLFGSSAELIDRNFLILGKELTIGENAAFNSVNEAVNSFVSAMAYDLGSIGELAGWISGITAALIVSVAILIGVFKLFFELLKTYVTLISIIAFSPLLLMFNAIPGKNTFGPWLKNLIGNLAAFPTVLLLLILYKKVTENNIGEGGFMPPYMLGQGSAEAITTLVGIGIILAMPEAVKEAKKALGATEGIFGQLAKVALGRTKEGLRYGLPAAYGAEGVAEGAIKGAWGQRGSRNVLGYLKGAADGVRTTVPQRLGQGNRAARTIENTLEGKALDPNSWENALLFMQREEERKRREERQKKDVARQNKPVAG